ncbi:hypothetical protein G6O69_36745 [Pseudenhygromyxa sp. WMMC2535]|uniref:hypothetical protein n=1 Tax=Pseudenhygromyxa sp. WMMC2535 TaxID=2712867 RepID=UPI001556E0B6|nr:hypothetical protein [Pseudenhygromyxa sp. WMMC2535]NVB36242.1 hypothetical protein [Pseudenhygromyxa sp. WMMC2535]NVB43432.1 hypothetical protein [Pseudenhygromyxa sp. WMMC2535]
MATKVDSAISLSNAQDLVGYLGERLPNYEISARGPKVVVVGEGLATGVGVVIRNANQVKLNWQFPSMLVQILLTLFIVFTGLLPGLLVLLFVWLAVKGGVKRIEGEVIAALQQPAPV